MIWDIAFADDSTTLLTVHQGGFLLTWDVDTHKNLATCEGPKNGNRTLLSLDRQRNIAATSAWNQKSVSFIDYSSGKMLYQKGAFPHGVNDIAFNNDGSMLAVATEESTLTTLDMPSGAQRHVLQHDSAVDWVDFSPNGERIQTCSRELRLWNAHSGELRWSHRHYEANPRNAIFSPDGQMIATAIGNRIVALIDTTNGEIIGELQSDKGRGTTLAFASDSRTLAVSTHKSNIITLWDIQTRQELCVLETNLKYLSSLAFSPDDKCLVAAGQAFKNERSPYGTGQIVEWALPPPTPTR